MKTFSKKIRPSFMCIAAWWLKRLTDIKDKLWKGWVTLSGNQGTEYLKDWLAWEINVFFSTQLQRSKMGKLLGVWDIFVIYFCAPISGGWQNLQSQEGPTSTSGHFASLVMAAPWKIRRPCSLTIWTSLLVPRKKHPNWRTWTDLPGDMWMWEDSSVATNVEAVTQWNQLNHGVFEGNERHWHHLSCAFRWF